MASTQILLMQKALEQMNLQLHKALKDITGVTGLAIIRAIVAGERNPVVLAKMRDKAVKKSEEEIAKALSGEWRDEQLFLLGAALELFDLYHAKMAECDKKIQECLRLFEGKSDPGKPSPKPNKAKRRKNEPHFDLQSELYRMTGVDLNAIDGISSLTALTVISECGTDLSDFASEKHFSSWLGLCPHNVITGGKVHRRRTRKVQSRTAKALRLAAQSLHHSKTALGAFYRRMKYRLGAAKATTATAHKLACLIYRMIRFGMDYVDRGQEQYNQQYQERVLKNLRKQAVTMGYKLVNLATGEVS
jgi:transposase